MKAVVFYEVSTVPMEKIMEVYPRHLTLVDSFAKEGKVIAIGTFADLSDGAMGIYSDKEAAEEFTKQDPFVLEGIVAKVIIREWNESLLN